MKLKLILPKTLNERLKKLINQAPVILFMKGSPQEPRCGNFLNVLNQVFKIVNFISIKFKDLADK